MDVKYINPFIAAITNLFTTMMKTQVMIGKPFLKQDDDRIAGYCAIIGFSGDAQGSVTLCLNSMTAQKVIEAFTGESIGSDDPDMADALGELCNMIAGQAKAQFNGMQISISLPRVIRGEGLETMRSRHDRVLVLPCDTSLGRFRVEVSMKPIAK